MDESQVFDAFRQSGALLEGHFQLSSGKHSDRYFQCALLLQDPARAELLGQALAHALGGEIDVVVGPAMGAVVWAYEVARALGVRGIFTERSDGEMCLRRGFAIEPGERVLVVEDVVSTGGSAREVVSLLRGLGAEVVEVGCILNRSGGNPFADLDLELIGLATAEVQMWEPESCPLCAAGQPAVKPGSRPGSAVPTGGGGG